ncbi:MAG TPA: TetR/AcrR family transcriptional regulator [Candidatus Dormibacteraeota bacterium]|nr:TetR/AcrR family transcriptional regulator [Candidatus Dormibacteraeota bacterium]
MATAAAQSGDDPPRGAEQPAARRTRRSARTRERILTASVDVFARQGFHGARVADIAEAAGIAYGLVYHHFRNKDEILHALFADSWGRYIRWLDEVAAASVPFPEKLRRIVHFLVDSYRHEPALVTVMINEVSRSYEFLESHDVGTVFMAFDSVGRIVESARRGGEVRADVDVEVVTHAILGAAEMLLTGYVMGRVRRDGREAYAEDERQLVELLVSGIATGA